MLLRAQSSSLQNTRDLEDEDKKERNTVKLHGVLEDGTVVEVRREMLGKVISKGNLCFAMIRNIILLCSFSRHFSKKKIFNAFYDFLHVGKILVLYAIPC